MSEEVRSALGWNLIIPLIRGAKLLLELLLHPGGEEEAVRNLRETQNLEEGVSQDADAQSAP